MRVYCPYCKKDVEYKVETREIEMFKGIKVDTFENVAICESCEKELIVEALEDENIDRINNAYKQRVNIIDAEDIINFRKKFDVSQRELTYILGFGKMTINRYERGEIPSKSHSDYLKLLIEHEDEFIKKVEEAYKNQKITNRTYNKILSLDKSKNNDKVITDLIINEINEKLIREPNIYNGYKEFDIEIVENLISYIASKVKNLTITSLNKYLWYIDMISFKQRAKSITGLIYEKQKFGPTIIAEKYKDISDLKEKYEKTYYEDETGTKTEIKSKNNYNLELLTDNELKIVNYVIKIFKNKTVSGISELSHKEEGWKKTKLREEISYEYALKLK